MTESILIGFAAGVAANLLLFLALTARTRLKWRRRDALYNYRRGIDIARSGNRWIIDGWYRVSRMRYIGRDRRAARHVIAAYERTIVKEVGRD